MNPSQPVIPFEKQRSVHVQCKDPPPKPPGLRRAGGVDSRYWGSIGHGIASTVCHLAIPQNSVGTGCVLIISGLGTLWLAPYP